MTEIVITGIMQVATSRDGATATVVVSYQINGILPDFVEFYAVNAAAADVTFLGPATKQQPDFDVNPPEARYDQSVQLAAGTIYTLFLCPRTGTQDAPDPDINGDYWESACVGQTFTTTTHGPPPGGKLAPPVITSIVPQPAKVDSPNSIHITWDPASYQLFHVSWTEDGLAQPQTDDLTVSSWTATTAPGSPNTFQVQGAVEPFNTEPTWYGWGPTVKITAAENLRSLRQFLQFSGINPSGAKLGSLLPPGGSLRTFMQL